MLIKLWIISTRKMLIKPNVLLNRNGLHSSSWNTWCCRWVMGFVSQLLLLNQHIQASLCVASEENQLWVHFPQILKAETEIRYSMKLWSHFVSITLLWLTDDLSSLQGSCFLQANNGSAAKMPQVLVHSRGWKFCGAVWCEQRNHRGRAGSKCGCSAGTRELGIKELLSFSKLC